MTWNYSSAHRKYSAFKMNESYFQILSEMPVQQAIVLESGNQSYVLE